MYHEFSSVLSESGSALSAAAATGNSASFMVGRLSYTFGLAGPCVSTDTACSSSLVAAHLGLRSVLSADATAAVAGGANLMLSATTTAAICQLQALSPVGRCKTFEASADGYGRGEGFAVMVLAPESSQKPGAAAVAVLRSTAVNQDGRSSSLTAPNGPAQAALVAHALSHSSLDAVALSYVALHGTGTPLGDPIEANALGQVLGSKGSATRPLSLGSVKSCYGHTEGAAGLTGLLLATGAAVHAVLPPFMHLRSINKYVEGALEEWTAEGNLTAGVPRAQGGSGMLGSPTALAGTSSFGMSGVNAHAIVSVPQDFSELAPAAGLDKSAVLHSIRIWPLPALSCILDYVVASRKSAAFVCSLSAGKASQLWERAAFGKKILAPSVILEAMVASGVATSPSLTATSVAVLDATFGIIELLPHTSAELHCELNLVSGATEIHSAAGGVSSAYLQVAKSAAAVAQQGTPSTFAALLPASCFMNPMAPFLAVVVESTAQLGFHCHPQQLEGASILTMNSKGDAPSAMLACTAFQAPSSAELNSALGAGDALVLASWLQPTAAASLQGLVIKSLADVRRNDVVHAAGSPAWQLTWQPAQVVVDTDAIPALCLTVSTTACPLSQLCCPDQENEASLHALNVVYSSDTCAMADVPPLEIVASSEAHLELLLRSTTAHHCLYTALPPQTTTSADHQTSVNAMLATYKAVLRCKRRLQASLVTFNAIEILPFAVSFQQTAALLQGIARTLFMEDRSMYGPSLDLETHAQVPLSGSELAAALRCPGEFAMAVRGGRTYSLQLGRAMETKPRLEHRIRSAFVAGGTKVRCFPGVHLTGDFLVLFSTLHCFLLLCFLQGLGLEYCRGLVQRGCRLLVITSRSGAIDPDTKAEFAKAGAEVLVLKADGADAASMAATLAYVREELPYIEHYAHAAGVSGFDMLLDLEPDAFWNVTNTKASRNYTVYQTCFIASDEISSAHPALLRF